MRLGGASSRLVAETEIEEKTVFAGYETSTVLRVKDKLAEVYGGDAEQWFHSAGYAWMFDPTDGRIRKAEVHWFEEPTIGVKDFVFKAWLK